MLSWIQRSALFVLLRKQTALVQDMKPDGVEANLFAYHLEGLQSDGYIKKVGRGTYTLTTKGQRFVGAFSTATNKQHEFIKTVIMLYAKTDDDRYLLFRWSRQPYIEKVGMLHDHMPLGKSLDDGIKSAMHDKLGTQLVPHYRTNALIKIEHEEELVSHMNALVYEVDVSDITLPYVSRNGTAFLADLGHTDTKMDGIEDLLTGIERLQEPREYILRY